MKKPNSLNIGGVICLILVVYLCYFLLLKDNLLSLSISNMLDNFDHYTNHWHILTFALLPIYVALMIFGASILGISLGCALQRWLVRLFH